MLPKVYVTFFEDVFGPAAAKFLATAWYRYSQLQLSSASREDLIIEARAILAVRS